MPILHNFTKVADVFTLQSLQAGDITYTLKQFKYCTEYISVSTGIVTDNASQVISIPTDGKFQLTLSDADEANPDVNLDFKSYLKLETSLINDIEIALCDCGCEHNDCTGNEYHSECNILLTATAKMQALKGLISPSGNAFFEAVQNEYTCTIEDEMAALIIEETVSGDVHINKTVVKRLLALNFLALYYYHLAVSDVDNDPAVRTKFQIDRILPCISKLRIRTVELENTISNMGIITFNNAAHVNAAITCVGNNTLNSINRAVTVITLAMVSTGTTPAYVDPEGDPVGALRVDVLPVDGVLNLDGVPVVAGDIILVANLNNNELTYTGPNQDAISAAAMTFSLRDTVNGTFVSTCTP